MNKGRQNATSVANCQATRKNEIETMVLLVTVHTERNKNIASSFTANWFFDSAISPLTTRKWVTEHVYCIHCHITTCR